MPCWPASSLVGPVAGSRRQGRRRAQRLPGQTAVEKARRIKPTLLVGDVRRLDALPQGVQGTIVEAVAKVPSSPRGALGRRPGGHLHHPRPHRRCAALCERGQLRLLQRHRTHRGVKRTEEAPSPQPRGNRQLNHAMHIIAFSQLSHPVRGATTTSARSPRARPRRKRCAPSSVRSPTSSIANWCATPNVDSGLGRTTRDDS